MDFIRREGEDDRRVRFAVTWGRRERWGGFKSNPPSVLWPWGILRRSGCVAWGRSEGGGVAGGLRWWPWREVGEDCSGPYSRRPGEEGRRPSGLGTVRLSEEEGKKERMGVPIRKRKEKEKRKKGKGFSWN